MYFTALKNAEVPAEPHIYAIGGHAFGLRPNELPITRWPHLVDEWFKTIGIVPKCLHSFALLSEIMDAENIDLNAK